MKKIVIILDSFKGSLSSKESSSIIEKAVKKVYPDCITEKITVADGGEGSIDAFIDNLGGKKYPCKVTSAKGEVIESYIGLFSDFAVIETASSAGITLMQDKKDVMNATTYGMGEQIKLALDLGIRRFIIALGGSATNDAGCGMASALGVKFYDESGNSFIPVGGTLSKIKRIDKSGLDKRIFDCEITGMCDIDNPLYGKNGAAFVFAPQKGADGNQVLILDEGLKNFEKASETELNTIPGAGAAGGLGAGIVYFLNAKLKSGIDIVLDSIAFEEKIKDADMIITGEGCFDSQSLSGKVPVGISRRAKKLNKPVIVICGSRKGKINAAYDEGITAIFDITPFPMSMNDAIINTEDNLYFCAENILRLLKI